jgi:hypothetical protein
MLNYHYQNASNDISFAVEKRVYVDDGQPSFDTFTVPVAFTQEALTQVAPDFDPSYGADQLEGQELTGDVPVGGGNSGLEVQWKARPLNAQPMPNGVKVIFQVEQGSGFSSSNRSVTPTPQSPKSPPQINPANNNPNDLPPF